jgi:hypothetical protein
LYIYEGMSEDTIYELIEILDYASKQRDWNSVEEALSILREEVDLEDLENSDL